MLNKKELQQSELTYNDFLKIIKADEDNQKPTYFTILPASVRYSKELTHFEKILFSEIVALTHVNYDSEGRAFCHANNNYFARAFEKNKMRISEAISNLQKKGFIYCKYIYENKECKARLIYINEQYILSNSEARKTVPEKHNTSITEKADTSITEKADTCITEKADTCITGKAEYNNINTSNTSQNKINENNIKNKKKKITQTEIALLFYDIVENSFKLDNKLYDISKLLEFVIDTVNNTLDIPNLNQYIISLVNIYSDRFIYKN